MSEESIVDLVKKHQAGVAPEPESPQSAGVAEKAQAMAETLPADRRSEEILDQLLSKVSSKMSWVEVDLPSRGLLYETGTTSIKIRPFTFDEERMLKSAQAMDSPDETLEKLLRRCVEGIDVAMLTPQDRLYVLFRLRGISYGDVYPIEHSCDNCGTVSKLDLSIKTLGVTPLEESMMKFTLPDSEQEVQIKLPRVQDVHLYNSLEAIHQNMHLFIYSVAGVKDKTIIEAFIRKTTVRDIDTLRSKIFSSEYGMEDKFFYSCQGCSKRNQVSIDLNPNFFTAS